MNAIRLAWLELRRFRGPVRWLVPVVLVLVPLLYGAVYLWSNWNPYGRLDKVPVAVVDSDRPVVANGELVNAGQQFTQQLRADRIFDWHFVSGREARDGLERGRYYFTIEVPKDFSAKLATASQPNPQRATLITTKNDANGYIAGIMADTVRSDLQNQINAAAHTSYARALYGKLGDARQQLTEAAGASKQLVDGTALAQQASSGASSGMSGIRGGASQITEGAQQISQATAQLDAQLNSITGLTAEQLPSAVNALANASGTAVSNLTAIKTGTAFVADRGSEGVGHLRTLAAKHPELDDDPVYGAALDNAQKLAHATSALDADAGQALAKAQDANVRALTLQRNLGPMQQRVRGLTAPADALRAGTANIAGGSGQVTGGIDGLAGSSGTLQTGTGQLNGGAQRLDKLIHGSLSRIPPTNPGQVARAADVLGSPSQITTANLNPAHVYGRGLAPFFFGIALWVFGLIAYLVLKPLNQRALAARSRALTIALGGWLPAAGLGALGGLVLLGVVDIGLGLAPLDPLGTIGLVALGTAAFTSVDHFLRTALGAIGGVVSLALLVLQLTACGGLYPMETTPTPFQAVHPYLPMTYLVDGLRVTISGGLGEHLARDVVVLGCMLAVLLALTTLVTARQRVWTVGRLHPPVDL